MDPISPELVLVDPELARWARARLPEHPYSNGTARFPIVRRPAVETARPRRALAQKLLLGATAVFVFALGALVPQLLTGGDPSQSTQPPSSRESEQPPALVPPTSGGHSPPATSAVAETPAPRRRLPKSPSRPAASSVPAGTRDVGRAAGRVRAPTRMFVWLPHREASHYHVRFFEGTRTLFEAWPTGPRVTIPLRGTFRGKRFAFTGGRYRWIVRPAFGPRSQARYGEPIVRSVWVVRS